MVLDEFYRNYFKKHGYSLESKLNKYFLYDCMSRKVLFNCYFNIKLNININI